ncbi:hypothetical protein ACERII_06185 [Evansella sp. AB-rgal1]|uniref:hypothetical protein n=1 Tax=Evansella sp. AB-rgal1 TaxID=3242696 RepID=UPI00359D4F89
MRKMNFDELTSQIDERKKEVESRIRENSKHTPRKLRGRTRSKEESEALTKLAIASWKKAEREGKIKYLSDRVMYYDYT